MTDLEEMQASLPPRPEALCRRLARRGSPLIGFIAYGLLYVFFVCGMVMGAVAAAFVAVLKFLGHFPAPAWAEALGLTIIAAAVVLSAWPFCRWVRRRRREMYILARDGVLVTGKVTGAQRITIRSSRSTRGSIAVEVGGETRTFITSFAAHLPGFVPGAIEPVLVHPASRFALTFPLNGHATPAREQRRRYQ